MTRRRRSSRPASWLPFQACTCYGMGRCWTCRKWHWMLSRMADRREALRAGAA